MLDRVDNDTYQEFTEVPYEHAGAVSATVVHKLRTARRPVRIDRVEYVNPTGFAADPANYWTLELRKGATVIASYSTQTAAQGAITANTFVTFVLSATDANRVAVEGDELSLALVKSGTAGNLPLGRMCAHGRYV